MACCPSHLPLAKLVGGHREASQTGSGGDRDDPNLQVWGMDPSQHSTGSYWDAGGQC